MAIEIEHSHQYFVKFCCQAADGSRGRRQYDKMAPDTEEHMNKRGVSEFLPAEK